MRIDNQGNLGRSNATPEAQLHISGGAGANAVLIEGSHQAVVQLHNENGANWQLSSNIPSVSSTGFAIFADGSSERPFVINNNNVGIGTVNPSERLAVNGTIKAKEIIVTDAAGDWADFVFADDYVLPSLAAVRAHIETHGHLPSIPSAEEVEADGISVGVMQAKLLQKIEELTLYTLDQQAVIDELRAQQAAQAKRIARLEAVLEAGSESR